MQTILGSGGPIGVSLAQALTAYNTPIRLVSRNPEKVNEQDELMPADLLNADNVYKAIEGSSVAYVTVGFPYNLKVWQQSWPVFIDHVINACRQHQCKLVFFDNVYMYDAHALNGMTEDAPINPPSRKGKIRAQIADNIMQHVKDGTLTALIARSADFYGPGKQQTSVLAETVIKPLSEGKKATWLGNEHCRHSFTYTPDAGLATAMLGNTDDAYNQVWHLPTAPEPPTGKEWIEIIAAEMGKKPSYRTAGRFMVSMIGLFTPVMKEIAEMMYQNDRDYVFNSDKFEKRFNVKPTPYLEGIRTVLKTDYAQ